MSSISDTEYKIQDTVVDFPDTNQPARKREEAVLATSGIGAYLSAMRSILLIAVLFLMPGTAFAACVPLPTTEDRAQNLANERALVLCQARALHDATARQSQQLQLQADLQAQRQNFELELRMQQTFNAAATPPVVPAF